MLEELAEINKALQITQTGTLEANNLLDKRDMALNKIAEFVDIRIDEHKNGSVDVYTGDVELIKGSVVTGQFEVQTAKNYCLANGLNYPNDWVNADGSQKPLAVLSLVKYEGNTKTVLEGNINDSVNGGSIGGLIHSADLNAERTNVGIVKSNLDKLAQSFADVFNNLNIRQGAYCIDPNNTNKLIATTTDNYIFVNGNGNRNGITAGNIQINSDLLTEGGCWNLACAYFDDPNNFDENAIGNAQNVADMLGTRSAKLDSLNGMTLEDFYTHLLGKVASAGSNAQNLVDTQQNVVDSIKNKISANNSVDLNQELVDLVKYQTAYAASAQVFNTVNSCLDTLMALGG